MDKTHAVTFLQLHIDNTPSLRTRVTRAFEECAYALDRDRSAGVVAYPTLQVRLLEIARDGSHDCAQERVEATLRDFSYSVCDHVCRNHMEEFAAWYKLDWPAIKAAREARAR